MKAVATTLIGDGPDTNAIPWLLLAAKSVEGNGVFAKTQSMQEVNTVGGKAPTVGCNQTQKGSVERVAYRATHNFHVSRP